jgi:hypothetical protein
MNDQSPALALIRLNTLYDYGSRGGRAWTI